MKSGFGNRYNRRPPMRSLAVILGSSFHAEGLAHLHLAPEVHKTPYGNATVHRVTNFSHPAFVLFRHGSPHQLLPNQINYRANAWALRAVHCGALLVTSSVGVMTPHLPLYRLLLLRDVLYPENRLPNGETCTMFSAPSPDHGHLVLNEGLFSNALSRQIASLLPEAPPDDVLFAYAGGPRTKTPSENRYWAKLGAQVNSMTLAPEVVLANELEIPCAGLVVGHKYSIPDIENPDQASIAGSLDTARTALQDAVLRFLEHGSPVPFGNHVFRFDPDKI